MLPVSLFVLSLDLWVFDVCELSPSHGWREASVGVFG